MFSGEIESKYSSYHARSLKEQYDKNYQAYKDKTVNAHPEIIINEHDIIDFNKNSNDFLEKINISFEPEYIGNKIYLNPFLVKFFEENPFKLQERTYPVDFGYKNGYTYLMQIDLGDTIKINEIKSN
jgi:hypothetical protein